MENKEVAISLRGITKTFGDVTANSNVNLDVYKGEILSLLGENGSGKTTLMNMLAGIYYPDAGQIIINGREAVIRSPRDAFDLGIGMVHQHFKLIDVFDTTTFTVNGEALTSYMADVDTDPEYTADTEVITDGYFAESGSEFRSAPYFDLQIDGISLLDTAY